VQGRYLTIDVGTASPEAIVTRLLARAVQSARDAREAPAGPERTRRLTRSLDILEELRSALDFSRGGDVARNLDRLYAFAAERLLRASVSSAVREIDEALVALEPIAEAFAAISTAEGVGAPP
jgi:flagellar protein FliS